MISTNVFNIITTYIDWKSKNFISDVILTNKSIVNGYIKFINEDIWFKFTTKDHLKDWIKHTRYTVLLMM